MTEFGAALGPHGHSSDDDGGDDVAPGSHPWRDVRAYGAEGDGETDDSAAIQSALDDGGIIWVPHSHEFRADGLDAPTSDPVAVVGDGTIKRRDGDPGTDWILRTQAAGSRVEGITLDGNAENSTNSGRDECLRTDARTVVVNVEAGNTRGSTGDANHYGNAFQNTAAGTKYLGCRSEDAYYAGFRTSAPATYLGCTSIARTRGFQSNLDTPGVVKIADCYAEITDDPLDAGVPINLHAENVSESVGIVANTDLRGSPAANGIKMPGMERQVMRGVDMDFDAEPTHSFYIQLEGYAADAFDVTISDSTLHGWVNASNGGVHDWSNVTVKTTEQDGITPGPSEFRAQNLTIEGSDFGFALGSMTAGDLLTVDGLTATLDSANGNRLTRAGPASAGDARFTDVTVTNGDVLAGTDARTDRIVIDGVASNDGDPSAGGEWNGNGYERVEVWDRTNNAMYRYVRGGWV